MKRATHTKFFLHIGHFYFNPRPREKGDICCCPLLVCSQYFNPRPREKGDTVSEQYFQIYTISIHALVKRATRLIFLGCVARINFNPRPREKGDQRRLTLQKYPYNFNPRPREKGDLTDGVFINDMVHFNPRPREKGDGFCVGCSPFPLLFQSTPS